MSYKSQVCWRISLRYRCILHTSK